MNSLSLCKLAPDTPSPELSVVLALRGNEQDEIKMRVHVMQAQQIVLIIQNKGNLTR